MMSSPIQLDPLDSPHPIPWSWITTLVYNRDSNRNPKGNFRTGPKSHLYRSPALVSPSGEYAAYSRIQVQVMLPAVQSRVASILFLENLKTGSLQTIVACSPLAERPFISEAEPDQPGTISILVPIAWSETGDRLLARQFESLFGSSLASDFAVIWQQQANQSHTLAPVGIHYTNAVLLGWSQRYPDRALFRAGVMGVAESWNYYAVSSGGAACAVPEDQPLTYGRTVDHVWSGPQTLAKPLRS
jgi:hypothetical protein